MLDQVNYQEFYDDEAYLLKVGEEFRKSGKLDTADFYMLLAWKADRAKNYHRERLKNIAGDFPAAVARLAADVFKAPDGKSRLEILMTKWAFYIPTATAILTIFYPDEFTVYDTVVCHELSYPYRPDRHFSEKLWTDYQAYKSAVIDNTPGELTLRDKDRYLIGKAYWKEVQRSCLK